MAEEALINLNNLFSKKIFRIPDYQRGYSWEDTQLSEFWADLLNVYQTGEQYYTGMLSLKKLSANEVTLWDTNWMTEHGNYVAYHIVDGQQRLTTIEILIKTIINFCETNNIQSLNGDEISKWKDQYLERKNSILGNISYIFGYEVDEESENYFKYKIMENPDNIALTESIYTRNMIYAKDYFEKHLELFLKGQNKEIDITTATDKLNNLFEVLTTKLMFNIYYVEDSFNVYLAFEAMNNRGKRLSNLELLKNRLIYLSTIFDIDDTNKTNLRIEINNTWKEIYKQLGYNPNNKLDDEEYLKSHWMIYFGYNRSVANPHARFLLKKYFVQKNIKGLKDKLLIIDDDDKDENVENIEPSSVYNYLASIKRLASKWMYINNPDLIPDDDDEDKIRLKNILIKLDYLNRGYFSPLILVVYDKNEISDSKKALIFEKIEKYQFLQFRIFNDSASSQNQAFYKDAYDIYHSQNLDELNKSLDICINRLDSIDNMENGYIDSTAVKTFESRIYKNEGFYDWGCKDYLLFEYEQYLKGNSDEPHIDPKTYFAIDSKTISVEHIYPQKANDSSWIKAFENYNDEEKRRLLHTIGNLLPLSMRINRSLQNIPFKEKKKTIQDTDGKILRAGYESGSYNEREVFKEPEWTAKQILKRGIKIVNFIENNWGFKFKSFEDKKLFLGLEFLDYSEKELFETEKDSQ